MRKERNILRSGRRLNITKAKQSFAIRIFLICEKKNFATKKNNCSTHWRKNNDNCSQVGGTNRRKRRFHSLLRKKGEKKKKRVE